MFKAGDKVRRIGGFGTMAWRDLKSKYGEAITDNATYVVDAVGKCSDGDFGIALRGFPVRNLLKAYRFVKVAKRKVV